MCGLTLDTNNQVAARTDRTTEALADLEHEFRALRKVLTLGH